MSISKCEQLKIKLASDKNFAILVLGERETSARPVSRHGARTSADSFEINRPPSTSSGTASFRALNALRPPTGVRVGTASRLASAMSTAIHSSKGNNQRIGSALGYAGSLMAERPITQHGLSGLPTSHGRLGTASGMRLVKDKRYWQAVLQSKINEITQETDKLITEKQTMDREQSAKRLYDRKVKEVAKDLTELQAKLTDINIALDSFSSGSTRQNLQRETAGLRERNEILQSQLENLFGERQIVEEKNQQIEKEIEVEKNKINDIMLSLPLEDQAKHHELQTLAEDFKRKNQEIMSKIEEKNEHKERLKTVVMGSQMRLEAFQLKQKLQELSTKRDILIEEQENKLSPEEERDKLIREVRANNQSLTSISHQMKLLEEQLNDKKEQLALIEQELGEGYSDRHVKYKELKRRDETMTSFVETFPEQMESEKTKLEILKNQIAYAIEQITLQGINLKSYGLSNSDLTNEKNDLQCEAGLLKEYKRLGIQLKQLQVLEKRTTNQLKQMMEDEAGLIDQIRNYSNIKALRSEAAEDMEELTTSLEDLTKKKRVTQDVVAEAQRKNQEIKELLRCNEAYRQILHLEEKLLDLMREAKTLQEVVEQNERENNYSAIKFEVKEMIENLSKMLLNDN